MKRSTALIIIILIIVLAIVFYISRKPVAAPTVGTSLSPTEMQSVVDSLSVSVKGTTTATTSQAQNRVLQTLDAPAQGSKASSSTGSQVPEDAVLKTLQK
ncbi:MAG: hypothetical protein KGH68_02565 [Patescibacteria group bacterium]|nr:hypothetical protein [Patescibacteria group bacterium]